MGRKATNPKNGPSTSNTRSTAKRSDAQRRGQTPSPTRRYSAWIAGAGAVALVVAFGAFLFLRGTPSPAPSASSPTGSAVQAVDGTWTNITPDALAAMLTHKDFTLLNVKTPYSGEIAGTDLYIPYDQLGGRAHELPTDKTAKIVVYCRSGHESAIAAQTLLDLGYTNIDNLDGGMTAWTASGRPLVTVNRGS